jgi:hypothetical protein
MIIFDIKTSTDKIEIICYEGENRYLVYEIEEKLCRYFQVEPMNKDSIEEINYEWDNNADFVYENIMRIDRINKEIIFYDFTGEKSISFIYVELKELNNTYEKIIKPSIKYLSDNNNNLHNELIKIKTGVYDINAYLCNEIAKIDMKIEFYKNNNDVENLSKNMGKLEIAEKILKKINKIL